MASMRDIKRRKQSVESTQQITKAMKLVSTVKLQRAKDRAEKCKAYFTSIYDTVSSILARSGNIDHKFIRESESKKKAVILITGNRGLAGGYNSNVIKLLTRSGNFEKDDTIVYAVGKKGRDAFKRLGYEIKEDYSEVIEEPLYKDAMEISEKVLADFEAGEIGEIYLAYTFFKNTVSHVPTLLKLLPVDMEATKPERDEDKAEVEVPMNFEPHDEEALDQIIPKYVTSLIFGALVEAVASENGARMQAMDSATNNATEIIDNLSLLYNRARQSSITQELTEIIAGADAIS